MVEVIGTPGRLGNKMFEYAFGRIVAEHFNYKFIFHPFVKEIVENFNLPQFLDGKDISYPNQDVNGIYEYSYTLLDEILANTQERKITINGYFQKYVYVREHKEKIKQWFYLDTNKFNFENSIGIHIRKGDQKNTIYDVPDSYFIDILKSESFDNVYITSDAPQDDVIKTIQNEFKNVHIFQGDTFNTLQNFVCFKKLITTASSYSWWMGFLSNAKVYMPNKTYNAIDLRVDDEERFILV